MRIWWNFDIVHQISLETFWSQIFSQQYLCAHA